MKKYIWPIGLLIIVLAAGAIFFASNSNSSSKTMVKNVEMLSGQENTVSITTETPVYFGSTAGFLAKPSSGGPYPGVVMVHEFWGLNDNVKAMAAELAKNGYAVLAVDIYEGEVTDNPARASELSSSVNQSRATENLRAAAKYLKETERVTKLGSIGWCFGGAQSLQLALSGEPMDATVIYYGRLTSDKGMLSRISWPVLGIFGEEDQVISVQSVTDFQKALNELGVSNEVHIYPGVGHAFANPSGMNYAPEETKDAWAKTLSFLGKNLKS